MVLEHVVAYKVEDVYFKFDCPECKTLISHICASTDTEFKTWCQMCEAEIVGQIVKCSSCNSNKYVDHRWYCMQCNVFAGM